ncbi:MAG: glycosyltransferase [Kiritimatiellae bacterium]|nr:glycosyltransferase [Kiritimatiellia bacterium]
MTKLSIMIPVFNEEYTIDEVVERVFAAPLPGNLQREVIVVDDCSTDGTPRRLAELTSRYANLKVIRHERNRGKGAAIRTAVRHTTGDICIVQDADLEYDPSEYGVLLAPILNGDADVVYGSRFIPRSYKRVLHFWHSLGNRWLTRLSNFFTDLDLTDMETCYKAVRGEILRSIPIRSSRFGIEPELTAKFAKRGCRIYEVPISYHGRSYREGKKITWWDAIKAFFTIVRFWLVDDIYTEEYGRDILTGLSSTHRFGKWLARTIRPWVGQEVLELGAGLGSLTLHLLPRHRYVVSDVDPLYLHYLETVYGQNRRVRVAKVDVRDAECFRQFAGQFDTVLCLNLLEHAEDDLACLRNIHGALKEGGRVCLLVPHLPALFGSLDRAAGHHRRYTRRELGEKLLRTGFELEACRSFNRVSLPCWYLNGRVLRRQRVGKWQLKLFDSTIFLWRRLDRLLPWPGLSLLAVGGKRSQG